MKQTFTTKALALLLTIAALMVGQSVWAASTFTVTSPQNNNTFRITRTGNTAISETIDWRVVSLSAIAGIHFTGYQGNYSGTVTFNVNDTYKDVTIAESTPGDNAYKYQNGTSRSYRFEVLDRNGDILASCDRSRDYGTSINSTNAFGEKNLTINSGTITVTDDGYAQAYHSVTVNNYYSAAAPKSYLVAAGAQLRMTVTFDARESDDGYQYIQIYANTTADKDHTDTGAKDGDPGSYNYARYVAGFTIDGNVSSTYYPYTFPVTSYDHNCGYHAHPWSGNSNGNLEQQYFKSNCRASDGRLIVPTDLSSLYVRMDASGNFGDTWYCQNLKAHIQAVDVTAPTVLNNYKVSGGRHQKGAVIYVSVPFSEIVTVTGTPTLNTSWGVFNYHAGSGSNVLTFRGEISSTASGTLYASGIGTSNGNVRDLAGNSFTPFTKDIGISLDADYVWSTSDFNTLDDGSCEIYTKLDLRHLALMVNMNLNECDGLTFKQTQDITCDNTYIPIGYLVDSSSQWSYFKGTYDGQGHTVSGITISNTNYSNSHIALFGYVKEGTVKKVSLANSTFTGNYYVGGIVAHNVNGTVQECRVESTVTIKAGSNGASCHGGIVGDNYGIHAKVLGCVSAAKIQNNNKTNHQQCGGIAGYNYNGAIQDCLYTGTTIEAADQKGGIVGFSEGSNATITNNYYTSVSIGGVNGSDQDGARRARTVTCGTGVSVWDLFTDYNVSGLTAIGTTALKSGSTIYSGEGQTLTLDNDTPAIGTTFDGFSATAGTISGNTLTMPASDVTVSAIITDHWGIAGGADGSEEHPYIITTPAGLDLLATYTNSGNSFSGYYFELGADIAYDPTALDDNGENYTAIGISSTSSFCGSFDGKEHNISGIRINKSINNQGLFGYIKTDAMISTVKNVTLADAVINGKGYVGGIVGTNSGGTIENCRVESTVSVNGTSSYVGGIVGYNSANGTIKDCYSAATVRGTSSFVGGIAGGNRGVGANYTIIQDCYSTATVSGSGAVGGIAGTNVSNNTIKGCRVIGASVTVTDTDTPRGGAIVGHNAAASNNYTGILSQNYYHNCTVTIGEGETATTAASGIGCGNTVGDISTATDVTEMTYNSTTYYDGAREVYALTLGTDITATGGTVEISSTTYYKAGATVTLGYSGSLPAGFIITYSVNGETITGNTFEMPADDATVSAQQAVPYIDANGDEQICTNFTIIQSGSEQKLGTYTNDEAWYVVTGEVTASSTLTFRDQSSHLIVCDGATLTAQSAANGICADYNLTIYGQSCGTGSIVAKNNAGSGYGIYASSNGNITINGGTVSATGKYYGIYALHGNITINGGTVSATGQNCGIYAGSGNITLGWTNADDRITASSYSDNPIVKEGQAFTDGTNIYSGILTYAQRNAIAGKTLQPFTSYNYALAANAHDGNYWTTFYSSEAGYKINNEENACAYTATYSSETLTLHKLGKVIPAGTAVVIVGSDNSIGMTFSQEAAEYTVGNNLHGVDVRTEKSTLGSGTFYVMGKQNGNFGFFQYTADYMPARKAYLLVSGGTAQVNGFKMEFEDDADGIKTTHNGRQTTDNAIYNLAGQRLNKMQKGINIVNGKKIMK